MKRCSLILALVVVAPAARGDEPKPLDLPPEVKWIPANSTAFVHLRFADLWNGAVGAALRDLLAKTDPEAIARAEQTLGVRLGDIDRLTVLLTDSGGPTAEESIVVRVTTKAPYDRKKVFELLGLPGGRRLSNIAELPGSRGAVQLADEKNLTFVLTRVSAGPLLSRLSAPAPAGRLAPALKRIAEGHVLVAAGDVALLRKLPWLSKDLASFSIARTATLVGDLKPAGIDFELRVAVGLRSHAEEIADALETRRRIEAKTLAETGGADPTARILRAAAAALKNAQIAQRDREVLATAGLAAPEALGFYVLDGIDQMNAGGYRMMSQNNLKQFALAMMNYTDVMGGAMPSCLRDKKTGKPLLSWRVAILPYLEQDNLFKQFHVDEPWDSEHNKKLLAQMPKVFELPGDRAKHDAHSTYYRVFVGNGAGFDLKRDTRFPADITDGTSNTIMIAEAADAAPWTKPEEIDYDPKIPPKLGYRWAGRANVAMFDGSVRSIRKSLPERTLHLLIQRADGEPVQIED